MNSDVRIKLTMKKLEKQSIKRNIVVFFKENRIILMAMLCLILSRIPSVFMGLHGINFDEAAIDYNIFCLSEYGVDRYGNLFPVYFANATSGQSALYVYIGVILSKIFGFSITLCRVVKLLGELVTLICGGALVKKLIGEKQQWIFYGLYIITPYFYKMSGMSFDCDLIIPMFVLCMYLAYRCYEKKNIGSYVALGVCVGLLGYSYIITVLMIPLFFVVQLIFGWNKKYILVEGAATAIVSWPIYWYALTLVGFVPSINTSFMTIEPVSAYRTKDIGFSFENFLNLKYMIFVDSQADFAGSQTHGTIYMITWIFVIIGIVLAIKKLINVFKNKGVKNIKEMDGRFFVIFFFVAFIPLMFIKDATTYNYTVLYYFILVLASIGIGKLIKHYKLIAIIVGMCYLFMFASFMKEYFVREPYIYGDDLVMDMFDVIEEDEMVMMDTTSVFQMECYLGIKYGINPSEIVYNEVGRGTSVGNIYFNDIAQLSKYDKIIIRNDIKYYYDTGIDGGLNDVQAQSVMKKLTEAGYTMKQVNGYCIYTK